MTEANSTRFLTGARIFDGDSFHDGCALRIDAGVLAGIIPEADLPQGGDAVERVTGVLAPAFVDLQINGAGGHQIGPETRLQDLANICAIHRGHGCAGVLPTLITDRAEVTARVIEAGIAAAASGVPGFLGLHLEGPHLDPRRKGAHDPALIRPMDGDDLSRLCAAAAALPALMVTLAPESATPEQIAALTRAGAVVSLGHSDCSHDTAQAAIAAGARCATHLFNAMSQLGNREPGLVGAVLGGDIAAGVIADGIHVHPETLRLALTLRPGGMFLVTDCMAFAGTDLTEILLNGRPIRRHAGRLEIADGSLAGADLTMAQAIGVLTGQVGINPARALAMSSRIPAEVIGAALGRIAPGRAAELVLLNPQDWSLSRVWSGMGWAVPAAGP
ncbi:N-acetylglucosamine-6-phosphate deacetylase [Szabonella alba]|uniref:N-acetylglucosamine-6-phosphate deacetylase n=1 Tax=Szabonella alba TaxID=2804194 RepID=A0A8K0Y0S5_9RHOB|nr:N-acetylglucosamine-6-phosphate deacetylase [Szabonella alba]MBL4918525.1 N-acetylglucosamine-6-phosphate deacetylase [Szabonella alba]